MSPLGETIGTLMNSMLGDSMVVPRRERIEKLVLVVTLLGEEVMTFFSNLPAWMSSITVRRVATRDV